MLLQQILNRGRKFWRLNNMRRIDAGESQDPAHHIFAVAGNDADRIAWFIYYGLVGTDLDMIGFFIRTTVIKVDIGQYCTLVIFFTGRFFSYSGGDVYRCWCRFFRVNGSKSFDSTNGMTLCG